MRTRVEFGLLGILAVAALPLAAAQGSTADAAEPVDDVLRRAQDLLPLDLAPPGPGQGTADDRATEERISPTAKAAAVATAPLTFLSKGLLSLGLDLIQGFFRGVSEGARTFDDAITTIAQAPARSAVIGSLTGAALGLASLLWLLSQRYGGFAAIPLFSRIAKADILNNKLRSDIFELIQHNPGIHVSDITSRLGIAWGTCTHHLQKLRAERMVAIRAVGHQKCYFPNGGSYTPREMEVLSATKNPTAHRIASYLVENGPRSHGELSQQLELSPALVSFHAAKLVAIGVIGRQRDGRRTIFRALETDLNPSARPMVHEI